MVKILQLCLRSPFPPRDGGAIAMESLAQSLYRNGAQVKILAFNTNKHHVDPSSINDEVKTRFNPEFVELDAQVTILGALMNMFSNKSYNVTRFDTPAMHQKIASVLRSKSYDCILIESLFMLPYVPTIRKYTQCQIVYRAHNIEHLIWKRMADQSNSPLRQWYLGFLSNRLERFEIDSLRLVDAILPLTQTDAQWFLKNGFKGPVKVVPVGIDVGNYRDNATSDGYTHVFHVGSMKWMPNVEGVTWLVEKVWPLVRKQCPELKLFLAGMGMPESLKRMASEQILISDYVDDLNAYMIGKQIMAVPLFSGSGIRVKILEGMAAGRTIISTTVGAEGIEYADGENILIADTPEAFASQLVRCHKNPAFAIQIGRNGKRLIAERYDALKLGKELIDFISKSATNQS